MKTFLPNKDPLKKYITKSRSLQNLENISSELPKLLLTGKVQTTIDGLQVNDLSIKPLLKNKDLRELKLAMVHLSFIAHAYIWGGKKPNNILPEVISKPWVEASNTLGRPPILSYASYCLDNWYRIDKSQNISLENVGLITNFLGGVDEDWFVPSDDRIGTSPPSGRRTQPCASAQTLGDDSAVAAKTRGCLGESASHGLVFRHGPRPDRWDLSTGRAESQPAAPLRSSWRGLCAGRNPWC